MIMIDKDNAASEAQKLVAEYPDGEMLFLKMLVNTETSNAQVNALLIGYCAYYASNKAGADFLRAIERYSE